MRRAKRILFVEGPAGAGKTDLILKLRAEGYTTIERSLGTRTPRNADAIVDSLANDLEKLIAALSIPGPVVIGRMFSQEVYGRLRGTIQGASGVGTFYAIQKLLATLSYELSWRSGTYLRSYPPVFEWGYLFIIPSDQVITERRQNNPERLYPWEASVEAGLYREWVDRLVGSGDFHLFATDYEDPESVADAVGFCRAFLSGEERDMIEFSQRPGVQRFVSMALGNS